MQIVCDEKLLRLQHLAEICRKTFAVVLFVQHLIDTVLNRTKHKYPLTGTKVKSSQLFFKHLNTCMPCKTVIKINVIAFMKPSKFKVK